MLLLREGNLPQQEPSGDNGMEAVRDRLIAESRGVGREAAGL